MIANIVSLNGKGFKLDEDADFIASANPETILRLIEMIRTLKGYR